MRLHLAIALCTLATGSQEETDLSGLLQSKAAKRTQLPTTQSLTTQDDSALKKIPSQFKGTTGMDQVLLEEEQFVGVKTVCHASQNLEANPDGKCDNSCHVRSSLLNSTCNELAVPACTCIKGFWRDWDGDSASGRSGPGSFTCIPRRNCAYTRFRDDAMGKFTDRSKHLETVCNASHNLEANPDGQCDNSCHVRSSLLNLTCNELVVPACTCIKGFWRDWDGDSASGRSAPGLFTCIPKRTGQVSTCVMTRFHNDATGKFTDRSIH